MGYLVCTSCEGYYELKKGESAKDFSKCQCDGDLKYYTDVVDFIQENLSLHQKSSALKLKVDDLSSSHSKLVSEHKSLKTNYSNLNNEYKSLKTSFGESSQGKVDDSSIINVDKSLKLENRKLKKVLSELNDDYNKLESNYNDLSKSNSDLLLAKEKLVSENSKLNIEMNQLRTDNSNFEDNSDVNLKLQSDYGSLKSNYNILKDTYKSLRNSYGELSKEKDDLEVKHSSISGDKFKLKYENANLKSLNYDLEDKYSKLESDNRILEENNSDLVNSNENLVEVNSKLKNEKDSLEESFLSIKGVNLELKEENEKLKEVNSEFESDNQNLKDEKSQLKEDFATLENSHLDVNSKLESENKNLKENYTFLNSILEDKFENLGNNNSKVSSDENLSSIEDNNISLKDKYSPFRNNKSGLKDKPLRLEPKDKKLKKNYSFLNSIIKDKFKNLGNSSDDSSKGEIYSSVKEDYSSLEDENNRLKLINSDLNEKNSRFEIEYSNLKKNYSDLTIVREKLFKENIILKKVNKALENEYSHSDDIDSGVESLSKKEPVKLLDDSKFKSEEIINSAVDLDIPEKDIVAENVDGFKADSLATCLSKLLDYIGLDVPFKLDDLKEKVDPDSFSVFENYLGELQERDLLIYRDSNDYILSPSKQFYDFCSKNGISISLINMNLQEDPSLIDSSKECDECKRVLSVSKFDTDDSGSDGYSLICKDCKRSRNAALGLPKLLEFIELDVPFTNDDLKERVDQKSLFNVINHIWQLMELDLISQEDSNNYILKSSKEFIEFCSKYEISLN